MDPLTLLLLAGAAKAAGGVASGIGQAQAAKASFGDDEEERLKKLQAMQAAGQGLTEVERGRLDAQLRSASAADTRELQASQLQQQAAAGSSISARDIFLQELAGQEAQRTDTQQQNLLVQQAETEATAANRAELERLRQARAQAEAQRRAGITQAFTLGLGGAGDVAMQGAGMLQQVQLAEAATGALTDDELINQWLGDQTDANPYAFATVS